MSSSGAAAAAAIAAARKRIQDEEEERLTNYSQEELAEGWEYKIVRSSTSIKGDRFTNLCREESQNGWELVEKFDDNRIRFKRPVSKRADDHLAPIDPYRSRIGLSDWAIALIILGSLTFILLFVFVIFKVLSM